VADDRVVNKHCDLTSVDHLRALLDDLAALAANDSVPIVVHGPTTTR
jgi:hypothetical protein